MIKGRDLLIYLAVKYQGDWDNIYSAIKRKEKINENELNEAICNITSKAVTIIDEDFPNGLKSLYKPPFVIFYHGDLSLTFQKNKVIGVIGSRECSDYGLEMVDILLKDLDKDYIVVSGLAKGIDKQAHLVSLKRNLKTISVLGSGINYVYPSENKELYKEIIDTNNLIISEYPECTKPEKENFVMRNRLIAGLANGLVVIEAGFKSGSLTTVKVALQQGKDIMCVPHLATNLSSCNRLIKEGAYLVENSQDIMEIIK